MADDLFFFSSFFTLLDKFTINPHSVRPVCIARVYMKSSSPTARRQMSSRSVRLEAPGCDSGLSRHCPLDWLSKDSVQSVLARDRPQSVRPPTE